MNIGDAPEKKLALILLSHFPDILLSLRWVSLLEFQYTTQRGTSKTYLINIRAVGDCRHISSSCRRYQCYWLMLNRRLVVNIIYLWPYFKNLIIILPAFDEHIWHQSRSLSGKLTTETLENDWSYTFEMLYIKHLKLYIKNEQNHLGSFVANPLNKSENVWVGRVVVILGLYR